MKLNERSVAYYATCDSPADKTGYLNKKGERNTAYHKRWFVLKGNMLFYFEEKESKEPVGVVILEGCTVELCESTEEYAFAIKFECAKSRTYKMAADNQTTMESWVKALSRASFDYMRLVVKELEKQLEDMQKNLSSCNKSVKAVVRNKSRPTLNSNAGSRTPLTHSPEESKQNGCVSWNNLEHRDALSNGYVPTPAALGVRNLTDLSSELSTKPPPLPPRRRPPLAMGSGTVGSSVSTLESPVSPETFRFSKLHDWFGKEIIEIRRQWQESQQDRLITDQDS
ncbi:sesquipedalian-1 [Latimeria chalumnae]|uniref:Sesquipedalian n=1 Tax=Latimeria chalumnae TaxID=7897 RepID=H3B309_LATCH|nr:PREDICTED: sesquipedalian-1 [Latimeria chalumnae]XP_005996466.1 PREDICTED: sesquipedalian-1 [Latimeria chalumnae]XP_014344095.1 PREDICTED: sesquipedalian-1 [Latimeria chalumnae]|eukprot:XP_005996465.1 PREDICTED: sesquipedalian-1 [Latimeria chalumnae]